MTEIKTENAYQVSCCVIVCHIMPPMRLTILQVGERFAVPELAQCRGTGRIIGSGAR